jgi:hypothetical protein
VLLSASSVKQSHVFGAWLTAFILFSKGASFFPRFLGDMSMSMSPLLTCDMDGLMSISSTSQPSAEEFSSQFQHQSDYASQTALLVEGRPFDEFDQSQEFGDMLEGILGSVTQGARRDHQGDLYNEGVLTSVVAQSDEEMLDRQ